MSSNTKNLFFLCGLAITCFLLFLPTLAAVRNVVYYLLFSNLLVILFLKKIPFGFTPIALVLTTTLAPQLLLFILGVTVLMGSEGQIEIITYAQFVVLVQGISTYALTKVKQRS